MSGTVSPIIINPAAPIGVATLTIINSSLQSVPAAISTGPRVDSVADNGTAYAVARTIRTGMAGPTAARQQRAMTGLSITNQSPSCPEKLF